MRVRFFVAAAIIAGLAGPGFAQQKTVPRYGEKDKDKTWGEREQEKEAERAYRRSLDSVPEKAPVDPWGIARGTEAPKGDAKSAAKSSPPKPKAKAAETSKQ